MRIDAVTTGDDIELIGVQFSIDFGAAGDQIKLADISGIQSRTGNFNLPSFYVITLKLALLNNRLTRG